MFSKLFCLIFLWQVLLGLSSKFFHKKCFRAEIFSDIIEAWFDLPLYDRISFFLLLYLSVFSEEFLFRYLPNKLLSKFKLVNLLISSLTFSFFHRYLVIGTEVYIEDDPIHFISYLILGALFWLAYFKMPRRKLLNTTNIHFLTNASIISFNILLSIPL